MQTIICEVKGYTITYDNRDKLFYLKNAEGEEVGSGKTQDDVEQQADKLAKQGFALPVPAVLKDSYRLHLGKVTSVNIEDRSCRFVYQEIRKGSHTKVHLKYSGTYELTEYNKDIYQKVVAMREQLDRLQSEIHETIDLLEKPINLAYFGL